MKRRTKECREHGAESRQTPGDDGFSMIATALGLLATAVLTAILLGTMLNSNGPSSGGPSGGASGEPGVAAAEAIQAQQTLSTGLTTADTAAISGGGYGSLQPSTLTASNPSITFVSGPSTNSNTLSMAVVGGTVGQAGDSDIAGAAGAISAASDGVSGQGNSGVGGGGETGTITLADRSPNGTCWLVWKAAGGSEWYGAETGLASCTAPALSSAPPPGPVSSSSIGWQQGSFPST